MGIEVGNIVLKKDLRVNHVVQAHGYTHDGHGNMKLSLAKPSPHLDPRFQIPKLVILMPFDLKNFTAAAW